MHATVAKLAWTAQEAKGLQRHLIYNVTSFTDYNAKALTISTQPLFVRLDSVMYLLSPSLTLFFSTFLWRHTLNVRTNGTKGLLAYCFSSKTVHKKTDKQTNKKKDSSLKLQSHISASVFSVWLRSVWTGNCSVNFLLGRVSIVNVAWMVSCTVEWHHGQFPLAGKCFHHPLREYM